MSSTVRIIWRCNRPKSRTRKNFWIQLITQAALSNGMDTAVLRHGNHSIARVNGKYVNTGDILNTKKNTGFALHYNVNAAGTAALPATPSAPNPELWELKYKRKGFVLIEGDEETIRDVE